MGSILSSCKDRSVKVVCKLKLLAAVMLVLVQGVYALDPSGQPTTRTVPKHSKIPCPSKNFSVFIRKFVDDEAIQRAFTQYPLRKQYLDVTAEPEPKEVAQNLSRHQIRFPVFPMRQERKKQSLEIKINLLSDKKAKVTLKKPDTGYQVYYFFIKNDCWKLEYIEDWST